MFYIGVIISLSRQGLSKGYFQKGLSIQGFSQGFVRRVLPARVSAKGTSRRVYPAIQQGLVKNNIQCSEAFGWDGKGSVLRKHLLNRTFLPSNAV